MGATTIGGDGRRPAPRPGDPRRARARGDGRAPARAVRRRGSASGAPTPTKRLPIDAGQTISQPYIVAAMTELLAPRPGDRVLELGTGSGYQAADPGATRRQRHDHRAARRPRRAGARAARRARTCPGRVEIRVGDGSLGRAAGAPYDGIIVTAAAPSIPVELRDQLADGGRLVIPVGPRDQPDPHARRPPRQRLDRDAPRRVRLRAAHRRRRVPRRAGDPSLTPDRAGPSLGILGRP